MAAIDNPFDKKMEIWDRHIPDDLSDATKYVHDTLDIALSAAQSVFGNNPPWEAVTAVYDRIITERDKGSRLRGDTAFNAQEPIQTIANSGPAEIY
uniref:Uncharacterized protein n=1 Tax=Candidatus Kentrum sp. LPFa TaxID=2126335 RepID=A0A450WKS8_9GAMM|nr:MAG: hypothetical protein BECKLPF1236B_GA0070989_11217 [Candidatus Kentron sp. LPFa]